MLYIKTYEDLDIDKYKSFIDKYKRTDYISKRTLKTMKELGIKDAFGRIKKGVSECYKIFNKQNRILLNDLFQYVEDDFDVKVLYNWYSIRVEPDFPLRDFTLVVSHDGTLPSKNGKKLDSEINIVDNIIRDIESVADDKRRELKERDRGDYFYKYQVRRMDKKDIFDNVKILPSMSIQIQLPNTDFDYEDIEEYERIRKVKSENSYKIKNELKKYLKDDIIDRYLKTIGISIDFDILDIGGWYNDDYVTYEVRFKI